MATTYAVASDLSGIVETTDGFGRFKTKADAVECWIDRLETDRRTLSYRLAVAKRMRNTLAKREKV